MTDERFTPENRQAILAGLGLTIVVDIDRVFDARPDRDDDRLPLAGAGAPQWRPVFRGAAMITLVARMAPFATLRALAPDQPVVPPVPGRLPKPGDPDMPPVRDWAVMTFGFATEDAAALAGITWSVAHAKALDAKPGDMLLFIRAQAFPPDWAGFA